MNKIKYFLWDLFKQKKIEYEEETFLFQKKGKVFNKIILLIKAIFCDFLNDK